MRALPSLWPSRPIPRRAGIGRLIAAARARPPATALVVLLLLALLIRVVSLETVPANLTADEADNLQVVYRIAAGREAPGLFGLDWKPAPAFSVHLIAGFMAVFGWSIAGLRLASALLGALTLIPFYLVARRQLSAPASLVAAYLLATSLWHVHFSRSGWENVQVGLFTMLAAWSLERGLNGRRRDYALAGLFCALGLYGYFAGRAIVLALLAFLPFALARGRDQVRPVLSGYATLLLVCAVLFAPQLPAILWDWDHFNGRVTTVAITSAALPVDGAATVPALALRQAERMVRAFFLLDGSVVNNSRYFPPGRPIFDPLTGALFAVGLVFGALAWRRLALWWCLVVVPLGTTQVFSMGTPDLARAVGAAPALYLFVGYGFDRLAAGRGAARRALQVVAVALLPWAAYHNLAAYAAWIGDPATLAARQPAVAASEFAVWQGLQVEAATTGRGAFNAADWQEIRRRVVPGAPPASPGPPTQRLTPSPDAADLRAVLGGPDLLREPRGVALDASGYLYVVDAAQHQVIKLAPDGGEVLRWGREGRGEGEFLLPWDVAVDGAGRVYVLDVEASDVQRFDSSGRFEARLLAQAGLYRPRGLAVDRAGSLYVADTGHDRILKLAPSGDVVFVFGKGGSGAELEQPTDVAVDAAGDVYVAEPTARRIQRLSPTGSPIARWDFSPADTLDAPHLAVSGGRLLVTDPHLQRVFAYSPETGTAGYWGGPGPAPGQLATPMGLAADGEGRVYVADVRNRRIQVFRLRD